MMRVRNVHVVQQAAPLTLRSGNFGALILPQLQPTGK